MMKIKLMKALLSQDFLRKLLSALSFSLIKAPAVILLALLMALYLKGELSLTAIESSRDLLNGAAPGKVLICERNDIPLSKCERTAIDSRSYASAVDKQLATLYLCIALISVVVWAVWHVPRRWPAAPGMYKWGRKAHKPRT